MIYFCCDELRRNDLRNTAVNGIDFLEVLDHDAPTPADRQRKLFVHLINPYSGGPLTKTNIRIEGGERIRDVQVIGVSVGSGKEANIVTVSVNKPGDFSLYTLRFVKDSTHPEPPSGFDLLLSAVEFSFKVECASDFDCKPERICPPEPLPEPEIDYLAKDYASFRRLMLDRMALLLPQWQERSPADYGIALVELLAYVADYLSYQQDATATESYLGTARRRISVRRHARLVDYFMHDGANARTWVQIQVSADALKAVATDPPLVPAGTALFTRISGQPVRLPDDPAVLGQAQVVFETREALDELRVAHNELHFYTWTDKRCCLPKGSTQATLKGHVDHLHEKDVLIFEEILGPRSGQPEDADPTRRHAVRLTSVVHTKAGNPLVDPLNGQEITEITWADDDALPVPFCISAQTDAEHGSQYVEDVTVARGNLVLADHGWTIHDEPLGQVPQPRLFRPPAPGADRCQETPVVAIPPRFRPSLQRQPLTQAASYDAAAPASAAMRWSMDDVLPAVQLHSLVQGQSLEWLPRRDLLTSEPDGRDFAAEVEADGTVLLRFGDNLRGVRPDPGTPFMATYRIGNGTAGNVGAEALVHILLNLSQISKIRNPLLAGGGQEPERIEDVRQRAPSAFRTQERAVTPEDYAEVTERNPQVQRAAATFRWTGSWHTVFVTVDRKGGLPVDDEFRRSTRLGLERYRMAGYDLEIDAPRFISLAIDMEVCALADYFRSQVKAALLEVFSNRILPDGRLGVFHPDQFTFGQPVYLSRLYAAAQSVPGVASVLITRFERQGEPDKKPLDLGKLTLGRLEIARCDNDPNFAEHGVFNLHVGGGK